MNQEKIGKFIASCRKKQKLTQEVNGKLVKDYLMLLL